jgi:hypothetical protein
LPRGVRIEWLVTIGSKNFREQCGVNPAQKQIAIGDG